MLNATPPSPTPTNNDRGLVQRLQRAIDADCRLRNGAIYEAAYSMSAQIGALSELLVMALRYPEAARLRITEYTQELQTAAMTAAGRSEQPPAGAEDRAVAAACGGAR